VCGRVASRADYYYAQCVEVLRRLAHKLIWRPYRARRPRFDFFRPDYEWMGHFDRSGQPDSDYLRNRIARLTFDLRTGEAQIGT
jgi:hypothetical protein